MRSGHSALVWYTVLCFSAAQSSLTQPLLTATMSLHYSPGMAGECWCVGVLVLVCVCLVVCECVCVVCSSSSLFLSFISVSSR
jgi:hypothetical protein